MSVKTQAHMYFDSNERQWQTMLYSGRFEYFFELFMRCTQTWKLIEREFGFIAKPLTRGIPM